HRNQCRGDQSHVLSPREIKERRSNRRLPYKGRAELPLSPLIGRARSAGPKHRLFRNLFCSKSAMNGSYLAYAGAVVGGALALAVMVRRNRSLAHWAFALG